MHLARTPIQYLGPGNIHERLNASLRGTTPARRRGGVGDVRRRGRDDPRVGYKCGTGTPAEVGRWPDPPLAASQEVFLTVTGRFSWWLHGRWRHAASHARQPASWPPARTMTIGYLLARRPCRLPHHLRFSCPVVGVLRQAASTMPLGMPCNVRPARRVDGRGGLGGVRSVRPHPPYLGGYFLI